MAVKFVDRVRSGWNAFFETERDSYQSLNIDYGPSYGSSPNRGRYRFAHEKATLGSIYTRIGIDVAAIDMRHVRLDQNGRYIGDIDSGLNQCLTLEANIDQAARAFRQDATMTLLDKGVIALVPVDTDLNPSGTGGYDIQTLRVAEIVQWFPRYVTCRIYNDRTGERKDVTLPKNFVAIVENPLYGVMNEPNSTLQRLVRKLNLLDSMDEMISSGKLDLIIQLPFVIKTEARKQQAEIRRKDIEMQLKGSQYGIAYTDGTEKITQLNRPAENTLLPQIEYLTKHLYSQLGLTEEVFLGTATESVLLNYHNRTIEPLLAALQQAMKRTFLTKTARTQLQSIEYFRDPFKLVPVADIAEIADKFTRNEVLTGNEVRQIIGFKPAADPQADTLRNKNIPAEQQPGGVPLPGEEDMAMDDGDDEDVNAVFDGLDADIDRLLGGDVGGEEDVGAA